MSKVQNVSRIIIIFLQRLALVLFAVVALALLTATALAAFGVLPWITLPVAWNGAPVAAAGLYAQVGLTVLAVALCFFLPTHWRMIRLEASHRRFDIDTNDIIRAYHAAHRADREGVFRTLDAYDAMHARLEFMNSHPDLGVLEPELLNLAAKMSFVSRDLADAYSDERVARARSFLTERQIEVERFNVRLAHAKAIQAELSNWVAQIEQDEDAAHIQIERLKDEMETVLPGMNRPQRRPKPHLLTESAQVTQLTKPAE